MQEGLEAGPLVLDQADGAGETEALALPEAGEDTLDGGREGRVCPVVSGLVSPGVAQRDGGPAGAGTPRSASSAPSVALRGSSASRS